LCSLVLLKYRGSFVATAGITLLTFAWIIIWFLATFLSPPFLSTDNYNETSMSIWLLTMLIIFFWVREILAGIQAVTISGLMATWYFKAPQMPPNPTLSSFIRASWNSLGSICIGSPLISIVHILDIMARFLQKSEDHRAHFILLCFGDIIEDIIQTINSYAYVFMSVYGTPCFESAKSAIDILESSGCRALFNDSVIPEVTLLLSLGIAVLSGAVTGAFGHAANQNVAVSFLLGLLASMSIAAPIINTLSSAARAFFICFACDPLLLQSSKPEIYDIFVGVSNAHMIAHAEVFRDKPNPIPSNNQFNQNVQVQG
jgi:hypothetical protein